VRLAWSSIAIEDASLYFTGEELTSLGFDPSFWSDPDVRANASR
jgi:hypothetical protein